MLAYFPFALVLDEVGARACRAVFADMNGVVHIFFHRLPFVDELSESPRDRGEFRVRIEPLHAVEVGADPNEMVECVVGHSDYFRQPAGVVVVVPVGSGFVADVRGIS